MDLLLSARVFDGEEALELGVVNKVFDTQEELMVGMMEYAKGLATQCSPAAMAEHKRQVYGDWNNDIEGAFENAASLLRKNFKHPDVQEGIASYVQKRAPKFEGIRNSKIRDL
jgi:enoyl-CoA hydratase/carnithine racemase